MAKDNKPDLKLLTKVFSKIKTQKDWEKFLDDLLTEDEIEDLTQRIKIAQELLKGETVEDTAEIVDASTATVSKIFQLLKYGKGGFKKVLKE